MCLEFCILWLIYIGSQDDCLSLVSNQGDKLSKDLHTLVDTMNMFGLENVLFLPIHSCRKGITNYINI